MRNKGKPSGSFQAGFVSNTALRTALQFKAVSKRAPYLLILLTLPGSISICRQPTQNEDAPRKIVSDDFTMSRKRAGARASTAKSRVGVRARRTYRLVPNAAAGQPASPTGNFWQLGITIWRLRPARKDNSDRRALIREKGSAAVWAAERVAGDTVFREGDYVRLSVESPRRGYLYVIDRDLFADGTSGEPMLIFPWSGADNRTAPGRLIDIPSQEDNPSYFKTSLTRENQAGELLTFIVTSMRLDLPLSDNPLPISANQLGQWEKSWSGPTERYEMEGGAGELWTPAEKQAAAKRQRRLTREDPAPQRIYRVFTPNGNGVLVSLLLKYEK